MHIHKYKLAFKDINTVDLPKGAEILTIQTQYGAPYLWAQIDEKETDIVPVKIRMFETGHVFDFEGTYISTFQVRGGDLVFHAFVVKS